MAELRFAGGINQLDDELVNDQECIEGENFLLDSDSGQFRPRPGFTLKGTATNTGTVKSVMQLIRRNDATTTLIQSDEVVYSWNGSSSFTSKASIDTDSILRDSYWSLDDLLIITDLSKQTVVKSWDGTTFSTLTHAITGVTNLYAKYSMVWQNRVWLFNITTDATDNPHVILASEYENYDNYDNAVTPTSTTLTHSDPFFLTTPDLRGINGVAKFFDTLVLSTTHGELFQITGTDATDYAVKPFYSGSSAAGTETMVNTGNDLMYIRQGGYIERLRATEQFGDTSADDLSRQIKDEVADVTSGIGIYDQARQRVMWFLSGKILVLDKNIVDSNSDLSPWMKWTTQLSTALVVSAAKYIRVPGLTNYQVYFGGPDGQVYTIDDSTAQDTGSTLIRAYRKSRLISELLTQDNYLEGRIHYRRKGACTLNMTFEWSDNYADSLCSIPLLGPIVSVGTDFYGEDLYWGGDHYWGAGGTSEYRVSSAGFSAVGKSVSFFVTLTINSTVDFLVNKITTEG